MEGRLSSLERSGSLASSVDDVSLFVLSSLMCQVARLQAKIGAMERDAKLARESLALCAIAWKFVPLTVSGSQTLRNVYE